MGDGAGETSIQSYHGAGGAGEGVDFTYVSDTLPALGVRPEEQLVSFNRCFDPMQRIPPAPVQDVTVAATLVRLRHEVVMEDDQLRILAEASEIFNRAYVSLDSRT
jgi:hypothetical protein